jgi:signal transduction histidine kinase
VFTHIFGDEVLTIRAEWLANTAAWLAPPADQGTITSRTARNAYYVLAAALPITATLPVIAVWMRPRENWDELLFGMSMMVLFSSFFVLLKLGWVRLVNSGIIVSTTSAVIAALLVNGGIRDLLVILLPVILLFAGVLLSNRLVLIYGGALMLLVVGVYWAEINQLIRPEQEQAITLDSLVLVLVALGLMTFYLYITFTQLTHSGQQVQQQSESLQETVHKLQQIRRSLEQRTHELSTTNEHLLTTQRQLVEAEKMASLGSLVAGVSHEINTPLGIGITAATTLRGMTEELGAVYRSGDFRRAYFEEYLMNAERSNQLVVNNLLRVDQLVQSFKQLAVDQLTLERRAFPLKAYLEEIVRGLEPRLRHGQHQVAILVDEELTIDSYPGAFAQVITNLVINSLVHGYPDGQRPGRLQFHATVTHGSVHLVYQDDGVGIPAAYMTKIYEPFFTTARDRGGTGLGLHIVYNLVTQKLGGTIRHESAPNVGATFYLDLPLQLHEEIKSA